MLFPKRSVDRTLLEINKVSGDPSGSLNPAYSWLSSPMGEMLKTGIQITAREYRDLEDLLESVEGFIKNY